MSFKEIKDEYEKYVDRYHRGWYNLDVVKINELI